MQGVHDSYRRHGRLLRHAALSAFGRQLVERHRSRSNRGCATLVQCATTDSLVFATVRMRDVLDVEERRRCPWREPMTKGVAMSNKHDTERSF